MDELFESLTLKQTGKIQKFPIILYGRDYWKGLYDWIKNHMVKSGFIDDDELDLLSISDDPEETVDRVCRFCRAQGEPYSSYLEHDELDETI